MATVIYQPARVLPSAAGGASSTSEFVFSDSSSNPIILPFPSSGVLAGATGHRSARFNVRAWGRVTGGTTTNFTPQLQWGTSSTPASNTDLESASAVAVNSVSGIWFIEASLVVDDSSGILDGCSRFMVSGSTRTFTDWAAVDNQATSVNPDGGTSLGFVVTGTFSASNASNAAYMDGFVLEYLEQ